MSDIINLAKYFPLSKLDMVKDGIINYDLEILLFIFKYAFSYSRAILDLDKYNKYCKQVHLLIDWWSLFS